MCAGLLHASERAIGASSPADCLFHVYPARGWSLDHPFFIEGPDNNRCSGRHRRRGSESSARHDSPTRDDAARCVVDAVYSDFGED